LSIFLFASSSVFGTLNAAFHTECFCINDFRRCDLVNLFQWIPQNNSSIASLFDFSFRKDSIEAFYGQRKGPFPARWYC